MDTADTADMDMVSLSCCLRNNSNSLPNLGGPQRHMMTLVEKQNDYDQVYSYYFQLDEKLSWTAGQYIHLIGRSDLLCFLVKYAL